MHSPAPQRAPHTPVVRLVRSPRADEPIRVEVRHDAAFEAVRGALKLELAALPETARGGTAHLDLGRRDIKLFDVRRIVHLLKDEASLVVTTLNCTEESLHRYAQQELKLRVVVRGRELAEEPQVETPAGDERPTDPVIKAPEPVVADAEVTDLTDLPDPEVLEAEREVAEAQAEAARDAVFADALDELAEPAAEPEPDLPEQVDLVPGPPVLEPFMGSDSGRRCMVVERTLRSGKNIRFDGDVIVFGDVNPGSQIVAAGNILVLGSLRGLAHAGAALRAGDDDGGDERAIVLAFDLRPTQVRIGQKLAFLPERNDPEPRSGGRAVGAIDKLFHRASRGRDLNQPEVAWISDGEILVGPWTGRLPMLSAG